MRYHAECADVGRPVRIAKGIERAHPLIADALEEGGPVCVETTGASAEILDDLLALGRRFGLLLVRYDIALENASLTGEQILRPFPEAGVGPC